MSNPKVFEFAKEIGMTPLALMDKIKEWQIPVKNHMAELEPAVLEIIKTKLSGADKTSSDEKAKKQLREKQPQLKKSLLLKRRQLPKKQLLRQQLQKQQLQS